MSADIENFPVLQPRSVTKLVFFAIPIVTRAPRIADLILQFTRITANGFELTLDPADSLPLKYNESQVAA